MQNDPLALARAAARRLLSGGAGREPPWPNGTRHVTPAAEPVGVVQVDAPLSPVRSAVFRPLPVAAFPANTPEDPAIKRGARVDGLRPEITRIYGDVSAAWSEAGAPRPVITSGNDSRHMRGSRHYDDLAFDLRGNDIDAATARRIRDDLSRRIGGDYQVIYETFPDRPANNHIHVEYDPPARR